VEWAYRDLKRALEQHLSQAGMPLSPTDAFCAMHSVGLSVLDFDGQTPHLVSGGGRDARRVLQALGITTMAPLGAQEHTPMAPEQAM
jgi:hypothetical protein